MATLDERFGSAHQPSPDRIEDWEKVATPRSLMVVDLGDAADLTNALQQLPDGPALLTHALRSSPMLWIIDSGGSLRIAFEEYVADDDGRAFGIRMDGFDASLHLISGATVTRLGHPSLLRNGPGRIGGELKWVDDRIVEIGGDRYTGWLLSNASGRFGFEPDRTPEMLDNVADLFTQLGISVKALYIEPRR